MPPKLVIFDFDGTLFDSLSAITTSVQLTFNALLPSHTPPPSEIRRLISIGAPPEITFKALQPQLPDSAHGGTLVPFNEETWVRTYREIYSIHGHPLTKPYPSAKEVLLSLRDRGIQLAIISNKAVAAVKSALESHGLGGIIDEELIIGEPMFAGGKRKPHPEGLTEVLLPRLRRVYGTAEYGSGEVLMVGDTITDILFARNIGAKVCWCRFGQGDREKCEKEIPEFGIDELKGVLGTVDGM
ncbi:HAD-like domain-containing protein [Aspergillus desertorum]